MVRAARRLLPVNVGSSPSFSINVSEMDGVSLTMRLLGMKVIMAQLVNAMASSGYTFSIADLAATAVHRSPQGEPELVVLLGAIVTNSVVRRILPISDLKSALWEIHCESPVCPSQSSTPTPRTPTNVHERPSNNLCDAHNDC